MDPFSRPEGDPGEISASAQRLRGAAREVASQTSNARDQVGTTAGAAKGKRSLSFRAAGDGVVAQLDDAATSLATLAGLLDKAATNLHEVITDVAEYKRRAEAAMDHAQETSHGLAADDPARVDAHRHASARREHFEDLALDAKHRYRRQAQATAAQVDALTDRAVPDGHAMTPDMIRSTLLAETGVSGLGGASSLTEQQAWGVLDYWVHANTGEAVNTSGVADMSPAQAAKWWQDLTPIEQMQAIQTDPALGNVDGVAFWARDLANRSQIGVYARELDQRRAEILAQIDQLTSGGPSSADYIYQKYTVPGRLSSLDHQLDLVEDKIASLRQVGRLADQPDHHVIGLDLSRERAQAIVSQGDLDTASYTSVFTPGLTSTVQGMQGNDDDMRRLRLRGARNLRDAMTPAELEAAGGYAQALAHARGQVATVTWVGYQAPQLTAGSLISSNSVTSSHSAKEGGAALADFYRGLDQSRAHGTHGDAHVLAMAHSYGTTVQGYAAQQHGTGIDAAYFSESPGTGADSASDFDVPRGQVFYSEGDNDPVADARQFGADPSTMPGVKHLETRSAADPTTGRPLTGVTKHPFSAYAADGTTAGYNQAKLLTDQQHDLIYGNDTDALDHLRLRDHFDNPLINLIPVIGPGVYGLNKGFEVLGH